MPNAVICCCWLSAIRLGDGRTISPEYCDRLGLDRADIQFPEYVTIVEEWLQTAP